MFTMISSNLNLVLSAFPVYMYLDTHQRNVVQNDEEVSGSLDQLVSHENTYLIKTTDNMTHTTTSDEHQQTFAL